MMFPPSGTSSGTAFSSMGINQDTTCLGALSYGRASVAILSLFPQSFLQILVVFLLERRIARAGINVTRFVFAAVELHLGPLVVDVRHVGVIQDFFHKVRGNEVDALAVAEHDVARHHCCAADANWN